MFKSIKNVAMVKAQGGGNSERGSLFRPNSEPGTENLEIPPDWGFDNREGFTINLKLLSATFDKGFPKITSPTFQEKAKKKLAEIV